MKKLQKNDFAFETNRSSHINREFSRTLTAQFKSVKSRQAKKGKQKQVSESVDNLTETFARKSQKVQARPKQKSFISSFRSSFKGYKAPKKLEKS